MVKTKSCKVILENLSAFKTIVLRQHKSREHEKSWKKFENTILYYRSNAFQFFILCQTIVFHCISRSNFEKAEVLLEDQTRNHFFNVSFAREILPYAKWAYIIGTIGRVFLLAISYKKPQICKTYLFYELLMLFFDSCMVRSVDTSAYNFIQLLTITIIFQHLYFDFIPSIIGVAISQIFVTTIWYHMYEETIGGLAVLLGFNIGWLLLTFLPVHVIVT